MRRVLSLGLITLLLVSQAWGATSKQYTLPGAGIVFADSGGNVTMVFSNRATANGNVSAQFDKDSIKDPSTGAYPSLFAALCQLSFATSPTLGVSGAEYYIAHADAAGTTQAGGVGQSSATITTDQRRALTLMGILPVYNTTANTSLFVYFTNIYIPGRFFSVAWFNTSGVTTETSTTKHRCTFYPMVPQMQGS